MDARQEDAAAAILAVVCGGVPGRGLSGAARWGPHGDGVRRQHHKRRWRDRAMCQLLNGTIGSCLAEEN